LGGRGKEAGFREIDRDVAILSERVRLAWGKTLGKGRGAKNMKGGVRKWLNGLAENSSPVKMRVKI
jgi:hypothetical protein